MFGAPVVEAGGEQDDALPEAADRPALLLPDVFPGFMRVEEVGGVPLLRAAGEQQAVLGGHGRLERELLGAGRDDADTRHGHALPDAPRVAVTTLVRRSSTVRAG